MKLKLRLRQEIEKREIPTLLFRRSIKNLNLNDFNYTKSVDGQIRLRETRLACMENWNWEMDSSKKIMQGIVKELKIWEVFFAKKQIEQDKQELMNYLCIKRGILRPWVNCWLRFRITEQSKFLVGCRRMLRSWTRKQLGSDPRSRSSLYYSESQNHASPRLWITARYTEYYGYLKKRFFFTTTCSRRAILYNLQQLKEFDILSFQELKSWHCRSNKEKREWNEKRIVEYVDSFTPLPK